MQLVRESRIDDDVRRAGVDGEERIAPTDADVENRERIRRNERHGDGVPRLRERVAAGRSTALTNPAGEPLRSHVRRVASEDRIDRALRIVQPVAHQSDRCEPELRVRVGRTLRQRGGVGVGGDVEAAGREGQIAVARRRRTRWLAAGPSGRRDADGDRYGDARSQDESRGALHEPPTPVRRSP